MDFHLLLLYLNASSVNHVSYRGELVFIWKGSRRFRFGPGLLDGLDFLSCSCFFETSITRQVSDFVQNFKNTSTSINALTGNPTVETQETLFRYRPFSLYCRKQWVVTFNPSRPMYGYTITNQTKDPTWSLYSECLNQSNQMFLTPH